MPALNILAALVVIVYYVAVVFVGVWSGRKLHQWPAGLRRISRGSVVRVSRLDCRTTEDENVYLLKLFVANRDIPLFVGFASMTATLVGAAYLLGSAEAVYRYGLTYVQVPVGCAISLLMGGLFFAKKMRDTRSLTMIDPFQKRYGNWMGVVLSIPAVCADIFWTAATFTTLGQMAQLFIGVDGTMSIIASASTTFVYTALGSLYSVAYTDVLQLAVTFFGLWLCVPFCAFHPASGLIGPPKNEWRGPSRGVTTLQLLDYFVMAVCGGIPWQVYFQRVLASRSVFDAKMVSFTTALGCLVVSVPAVVIGSIAKNANFTAAGYDGPYNLLEEAQPQVLAYALHFLCPGIITVVGVNALLGAVMSSVDSSMLSASTIVTRNFYHFVIRPAATDREITLVLRSLICLLGTMSAILSLSVTSVFALWTFACDVVFVLLFPQLLSLFYLKERTNAYGAFAGFVVGAVLRSLCGEPSMGIPVVLRLPLYDSEDGQRFPFRTACMLASLTTLLLASHVTQLLFDRGWLAPEMDICRCCCPIKRDDRRDSIWLRESQMHTREGEGIAAPLSEARRRSSSVAQTSTVPHTNAVLPNSSAPPINALENASRTLPSNGYSTHSPSSPGVSASPDIVSPPSAACPPAAPDAEDATKNKPRSSGAMKEQKTKGKKDKPKSKQATSKVSA